jgi:hypothetical protein
MCRPDDYGHEAVGTYAPQEGVHVGRPPCATCGANYHLHRVVGRWRLCPEAYRPSTMAEAQRELSQAVAASDPVAEFVARGNVQRLAGRRYDG